jgi:hypothetical protein
LSFCFAEAELAVAAAMTSATTVKASATMEASAEARLPAGGEASGRAAVIKTAEGPGMIAGESMLRGRAMKSSPVEPAVTIESTSTRIEVFAIIESSAMRHPAVVVEKYTVMPIPSPVAPSPAKPAKEPNAKTKPEGESRSVKV